jgi:hypothetical protein
MREIIMFNRRRRMKMQITNTFNSLMVWGIRVKKIRGVLAFSGLFGICLIGSGICLQGCISPKDAPQVPRDLVDQDPLAGDFIVYNVANGDVKDFDGNSYRYYVGEMQFNPSMDTTDHIYNYQYVGDGSDWPGQTIMYNEGTASRGASDHPEAFLFNEKLYFYYTNQTEWSALGCGNPWDTGAADAVPDNWGGAVLLPNFPNCWFRGAVHNIHPLVAPPGKFDVDWYKFNGVQGTSVNIRLTGNQYRSSGGYDYWRTMLLSLYLDPAGAPIAESLHGMDYYCFNDPELGLILPQTATYYLKIEDVSAYWNADPAQQKWEYNLTISGTPSFEADSRGYIYKAEIQPARNGNPELGGGRYFEPDDVQTKVEDRYPDCDGIPGTGDEGDAGIYEICDQPEPNFDIGYHDGAMQYWEVDDRTTIDDGEWFTGTRTNIPTWMGEVAPTVVEYADRLLMWLNVGGSIYMARSNDGMMGLSWDLSEILNNRPSITPRQLDDRVGGDPEAPAVSSGNYGFCETYAQGDDVPVVVPGYGYPHTIGISPGDDGVLDTFPQSDQYNSDGSGINTGPDGIVNTFFMPSSFQYCPPYYNGNYNAPWSSVGYSLPTRFPGVTLWDLKFKGPGNPDAFAAPANPAHPLHVPNGICSYTDPSYDPSQDRKAYLLGNDEWSSELPMTPAQYWRKQRCNLFTLAEQFDRCAMGKPATPAIMEGGDYRIDTIEQILDANNDHLCHQGTSVGICRGPDGLFGHNDLQEPLLGDDRYCIRTDPELGIEVVAICPGNNAILETIPIGVDTATGNTVGFDMPKLPIPSAEASEWMRVYDVFCNACVYPNCEICPGDDGAAGASDGIRLDSAWSLYYGHSPDSTVEPNWNTEFSNMYGKDVPYYYRGDIYWTFDDELCIINNTIALCPGPNGYFQAYPLFQKVEIDHWEDYEDLIWNYDGTPDNCQELTPVEVWDEFYETEVVEYFLYEYSGVLQDDAVIWDQNAGQYVITSGFNGINQSCVHDDDVQLIERFRGQPYVTIITPGANGVLETYAMTDEMNYFELENDEDIPRLDTGPEGVANSFAIGDDRPEIYLGTGRPDMPCVLAGGNGIAETAAQGNDSQLYQVGEKTGFDAYLLATPEIVQEEDEFYLYYAGLGWMSTPEEMRNNRTTYNKAGECDRPGLRGHWGDNRYEYLFPFYDSKERSFFEGTGTEKLGFLQVLDNDPGVLLTTRIGVATAAHDCVWESFNNSSMQPLGCWQRRNLPVVNTCRNCGEASDIPIDLGEGAEALLGAPTTRPCFCYAGNFSPDIIVEHEESDGQAIFNMMLSGLTNEPPKQNMVEVKKQVGLARSLDGINWDTAIDLNEIVSSGEIPLLSTYPDLDKLDWCNQTLLKGDDDSYGMFVQESVPHDRGAMDVSTNFRLPNEKGFLVYAVRKGMVYAGCSLEINTLKGNTAYNLPAIISVLIMVIPFIIFVGMKILRKAAT